MTHMFLFLSSWRLVVGCPSFDQGVRDLSSLAIINEMIFRFFFFFLSSQNCAHIIIQGKTSWNYVLDLNHIFCSGYLKGFI